MPPTLLEQLKTSPRYAVTRRSDAADTVVGAAAEMGRRAAMLGRRLPLPLLLDVTVGMRSHRGLQAALFASPARRCRATEAYDKWLGEFCAQVRSALPPRQEDWRKLYRGEAVVSRGDCLALLLRDWPNHQCDPYALVEWLGAYEAIAGPPHRNDVLEAWGQRRDVQSSYWGQWPTEAAVSPEKVMGPEALWGAFALPEDGVWTPETFDHSAGALYLNADPVPPTQEQLRRVNDLMQRQRQPVSDPIRREPTEPAFYRGRPAFSVFTMGEYGDLKWVNNSYPKRNTPPHTWPPEQATLHLWFAQTRDGLRRETPLCHAGQDTALPVCETAVLQALVATLLDDWRDLLQGLRLRFQVHRSCPEPADAEAGEPGERWTVALQQGRQAPPSDLVRTLFARRSHLDFMGKPTDWTQPSERAASFDWWCGCVSHSDLMGQGFRHPKASSRRTSLQQPAWVAGEYVLPRVLSHLIIVDSPLGEASITQVDSWTGEGKTGVGLWPWRAGEIRPPEPDPSFTALRSSALDLVLDALDLRLR